MYQLLLATMLATGVQNADTSYLFRASLLRAAPGRLLEVLELYRERATVFDSAGDARPFLMRHRQGDQWDLLVLTPMVSFAAFYASERTARRARSGMAHFERQVAERLAWRSDVFVLGPPVETVRTALDGGALYHVEMFIALPGLREALVREREMENAYLDAVGRPLNLIFTRVAGAQWDLFTVGVYRDLRHFAESETIPAADEDRAARAAGFDSASGIGLYLRTLIQEHHDTLAGAVR